MHACTSRCCCTSLSELRIVLVVQEKVQEMQLRIDELLRNMPKKIIKKMELAAKRAAEQELLAETAQEDRNANKCVIA